MNLVRCFYADFALCLHFSAVPQSQDPIYHALHRNGIANSFFRKIPELNLTEFSCPSIPTLVARRMALHRFEDDAQ